MPRGKIKKQESSSHSRQAGVGKKAVKKKLTSKKIVKKSKKTSLEVRIIKAPKRKKEADKAGVSDIKKKDKLVAGARRRTAKSVRNKESSKVKKSVLEKEAPRQVKEKVIDYERAERDKRLIMWSGVTFFMVLVSVFWIFNINKILKQNEIKNHNDRAKTEWRKISGEISGTIEQMEADLAKIRAAKLEATEVKEDSVGQERDLFSPKEVKALKEKLEEQPELNEEEDIVNLEEF